MVIVTGGVVLDATHILESPPDRPSLIPPAVSYVAILQLYRGLTCGRASKVKLL